MVHEPTDEIKAPDLTPPKKAARRIVMLCCLALMLWCALGVLIYPDWWYGFIFQHQYMDASYWGVGNYYAIFNTIGFMFPSLFVVWAILSFSPTKFPDKLQAFNLKVWFGIVGAKGFTGIFLILAIIFCCGLYASGPRTADYRQAMEGLAKSKKDLAELLKKNKPVDAPPLSDPTSFAYIDIAEVESLYGQNEPELVPSLIRERIEKASHANAEISIDQYLKTDAGISEARTEEEELRRTEKNPQRKLKDLLEFLYSQQKLKRYGHQQWKSDELQKLEDATALLSKYGVVADPDKLRSVRDRLLSEEVQRLEDELSVFHGLVLVDGDWTVEKIPGGYRLHAPIVQQISHPLFFEFRLSDKDVNVKTKEIIETLKARPIRLTVFGNVIAGVSPQERSVHIVPIAAF